MTSPLATAFVLIRPTTTGFGPTLKRELDGAAGAAGAAGSKAGKSWTDGFQKSGVVKAANRVSEGILAIGVASVYAAVKFQSSMEKIHTQAGVAQKNIKSLGDGVLKLAGQVGASPDSLAESLYHVESAFSSLGITGKKALDIVKVAAQGAAVGGADLVDVTNALTAFEASGIKGARNMSQAMGIMNAIVGAGDMKMQDLADAFGTGLLASIKGFGVTIQDAGAALATFGDNNIRGAKAGTQLRMAVQALAQPTATGAKELMALGINSGSLAKAMQQGGLKLALETLQAKLKAAGVSTKETGQILTETFGKRAGVGIQILLGQMDRFESKFPALDKGANSFGDAWKRTQQTASQQLKELGASFEAMGVKIGDKLLPPLIAVMNFVRTHTGLVIGLATAIGTVAVAITGVSVAIKAWKAATSIITGVRYAFTHAWSAIGLASVALAFAIDQAVTAKGAFQGLEEQLARTAKATGLNVGGYRQLSDALGKASQDTATLISTVGTAGVKYGSLLHASDQLTGAQQQAAQMATNLRASLTALGGEYNLNAGGVKELVVKSGELKAVLAANGRITPQVAAKISDWAQAENRATGLTNLTTIAVGDLTRAMDKLAGKTLALQGDELGWQSALQQAKAQLDSNSAGLKGNSADAIANREAVLNSTSAVYEFAKQQLISKGNLAGASTDIQKQVTYLKGLKDQTKFTKDEIKLLVAELKLIKSEQAYIKVFARGSYNILPGGTRQPGTHPTAAGWYVTGGTPGVDSVPIMAMPGEVVVPTRMVNAGAVDHLRGRLPGFGSGGVVGSYGDGVPGLTGFLRTENAATMKAIENATAAAVFRAIRSGPGALLNFAKSFIGTPYVWGGTTPSGWDCSGFTSFVYNHFGYGAPRTSQEQQVWARPSGDVPGALAFFFGTGGGASHVGINLGGGKMVNAENPFVGTIIDNIFGGFSGFGVPPQGFDGGGWLRPGLSLAYNGTGRPEQVIGPGGRGGAGNSYHITVNVAPGTNMAEAGRYMTTAIREFERRSGKGWRS